MDDATLDELISTTRGKSALFDGDHVLRDAPLSELRIAELERQYDVVLNPQYRRFLKIYGAGEFLYAQIYSVDPKSGWSLWRESQFLEGIGTCILPFADNGCGDYLAFTILDGECSDQIYWLDHEQGYCLSPSDYQDFNTFIAESALEPS